MLQPELILNSLPSSRAALLRAARNTILGIGLPFFVLSAYPQESVPAFRIGDQWTFKWSQVGRGDGSYTEAVKAVDGDVATLVNPAAARSQVVLFSIPQHRYLQRYAFGTHGDERGKLLDDHSADEAPLRFPLVERAAWTVTRHVRNAATEWNLISQELQAEVKSRETITTPAGQFDAYKIVMSGRWRDITTPGLSVTGRHEEIHWYCPQVKRVVRREIRSYGAKIAGATNALIFSRVDELIGFSLVSG